MESRIARVRFAVLLSAVIGAALLAPMVASAAPVVADSYSDTNRNMVLSAPGAAPAGQSFTAIDGTLDSVAFHLTKQGVPTGNAYAVLYSHSGTYGTSSVPGSQLATSAPVDVSTIGPTGLVTFTFNNSISLAAGTKYFISFVHPSGVPPNYIGLGMDNSAPTHSGNLTFQSLNVWFPQVGFDAVFYIYETPPAPAAVPISSVPASSAWSLGLLASLGLAAATVFSRRKAVA